MSSEWEMKTLQKFASVLRRLGGVAVPCKLKTEPAAIASSSRDEFDLV